MPRKRCDCGCGAEGCPVCTDESKDAVYQATPANIGQTNTPVGNPTPEVCDCAATYNTAIPLVFVDLNATLPAAVTDAKDGGRACSFRGINQCSGGSLNYVEATVYQYQNNTGGVSAYAVFDQYESATLLGVGFTNNLAHYDGSAVIDADDDTIDCKAIDVTIPLTFISNTGPYGGPIWCGASSPLTLRFEGMAA